MSGGVRVPQPIMVLHGGGVALACSLDGQLLAEELHGLFAADTRVLSTYQLGVGGYAWRPLSRARAGHATASWEFTNPLVRGATGDIPAGTLLLSLRRRLDGALYDDLALRAFVDRPVRVRFTLHLDADFADIFAVKDRLLPPRLGIQRVPTAAGLTLTYEQAGFRRGLQITVVPSAGRLLIVGALALFDLELAPGAVWTGRLEAAPVIAGVRLRPAGDPRGPEPSPVPPSVAPLTLEAAPLLARPFARGRADLRALAVPQPPHPPYVAAGAPWFLTLFGRDTLVTALMAGLDGAWSAGGALAALGPLQATARDDWRDAEPGKLPHEIRRGELAQRGLIPHTPYYGTHDTPALYCLALWHAWRWTGDRALLTAHLPTARAALRWCDELGDRDGDGLQEYGTRSPRGYYNQSWKDAGDAILGADGRLASLPLATVELQGYLYAARLALAEILAEQGDDVAAVQLRSAAGALRVRVEERFWLAEHDTYALALDGAKRPVVSVASNPGHLLWCGLPSQARAVAVATRLLAPDLFSGWGLRTLSARHPGYNPMSYQRGSVWPHDTALAAAGLWRYGLREAASTLLKAILEAAAVFEEERLPELFCGLDRAHGVPVPYAEANSPQAWAAAVPLLAAQLFLGLAPDAPRGRCFLTPWLPAWLPRLTVRGIAVGSGHLDVTLAGCGAATVIEDLRADGVAVLRAATLAPLWGDPPGPREEGGVAGGAGHSAAS
ncbi:MAG TPA: glycogen debranching N-terminal domain-containing protein [Thermomicrobiales bacterium]|nr:glycogen debranching N-terminal domain-containing protein [Thermomicrobiales bacterium]